MMTFTAVLIVLAIAAVIAWGLANASTRTGGALLGDAVKAQCGDRAIPSLATESFATKSLATKSLATGSFAATPFAATPLAATPAPETLAPETLAPETLAPETLAPETLAPETFPAGSLALRHGLAEESHA